MYSDLSDNKLKKVPGDTLDESLKDNNEESAEQNVESTDKEIELHDNSIDNNQEVAVKQKEKNQE